VSGSGKSSPPSTRSTRRTTPLCRDAERLRSSVPASSSDRGRTAAGLSPHRHRQKKRVEHPRSTVGTITEVYDYLRVLYAKLGDQHCHLWKVQTTRSPGGPRSASFAGSQVTSFWRPLHHPSQGEYATFRRNLRSSALRASRSTARFASRSAPALDKKTSTPLRSSSTADRRDRGRLGESVELALREGGGELRTRRLVTSRWSSARNHLLRHAFPDSRAKLLFQ